MSSFIFEDKDVQYAYHIHDFFDQCSLSHALAEVEGIIKAATDHKAWDKAYPYRLLHFMNLLEALSVAALVIHDHHGKRPACILNEATAGEDMPDTQQFVGSTRYSTIWNCFPRTLSFKQYCDPYKALQKFAAYMTEPQWQKVLRELTEQALNKDSICDDSPSYNILVIRLHLLRLIEACHLLEVRSRLSKGEQLH